MDKLERQVQQIQESKAKPSYPPQELQGTNQQKPIHTLPPFIGASDRSPHSPSRIESIEREIGRLHEAHEENIHNTGRMIQDLHQRITLIAQHLGLEV